MKVYKSISDTFSVSNLRSVTGPRGWEVWTASLLRHGQKVAEVADDGHGGEIDVRVIPGAYQRLESMRDSQRELLAELKAAAEAMPQVDFNGTMLDYDVAMYVDELASEFRARKHAKKFFTFVPVGGEIREFAFLKQGRTKVRVGDPAAVEYAESNPDIVIVEAV